jgi:hypothetical protein
MRVLHLITGEEIIGVVSEGDSTFLITNPFWMDIVDDPDQGSGVRLSYLLAFSSQKSVQINKSSVVYEYQPSEKMSEYYNRLVEYTVTKNHDAVIEETIESMEEMDRRWKKMISSRFVGKSSVN